MRISIGNAEETLFQDRKAWKHIPDMRAYRDQWAFSKTSPHLRPTGLRAIADFILAAEERHEKALSSHFGTEVTIDKFDPSPIKNVDFMIGEEPDLEPASNYTGFGVYRDGERAWITFWR